MLLIDKYQPPNHQRHLAIALKASKHIGVKTDIENLSAQLDIDYDQDGAPYTAIEVPVAAKDPIVQLSRIEAALTRIDNNQYGYCTCCGEAIQMARLEVDPATARCQSCAK